MDKESRLMTDHSLGDKGKEFVLNFELSWVLRMVTDENYINDKPIFSLYSKFLLFKLIELPFPNSTKVTEVKVWKEWKDIDLIAEITINNGGKDEKHILMVENKVYTDMKVWQRDEYPERIKAFKEFRNIDNAAPHMVLLSCTDDDAKFKELESFCQNSNWKVLSIYDIILDLNQETESELFNEFWIYNWNRLTD